MKSTNSIYYVNLIQTTGTAIGNFLYIDTADPRKEGKIKIEKILNN